MKGDLFESKEFAVQYYTLFDTKENAALCAIIFEALAIEAYVNFWGASLLGDKVFYEKYEVGKKGKNKDGKKRPTLSTLEKIKEICKEEFHAPYPTDDVHYRLLKALFEKRDRVVHCKPKEHIISQPSPIQQYSPELYDDYLDALKEFDFIYDDIDLQMQLYQDVKDNLSRCSGKPDPFCQQINAVGDAIGKSIADMFNKVFQ